MAIAIELNTPSNLKEGDGTLIKEINAGLCRLKAKGRSHRNRRSLDRVKAGGLSRSYALEDRGTNGKRGPELE